MAAVVGPEYPEIWLTIAECVLIALDAFPATVELDNATRVELALFIANTQRAELGGSQPYLPVGMDYENAEKYGKLYQRFTGRNLAALAHETDVTPRRLHEIFKILRRQEFSARQGGFDFDHTS